MSTIERIDTYKARYVEARQYMDWFLPAWEIISEDDRLVLEAFFLGEGTQEDAVQQICNHFYVERTTAYQKKSRALARLATALYGGYRCAPSALKGVKNAGCICAFPMR